MFAVWKKSPGGRAGTYGLIAAGMIDFPAAKFTGVTTRDGGLLHTAGSLSSAQVGVPPLSLFSILVVLMFIILHPIAGLKLRRG